jgi:hypothetical protein
VSVKSHFCTFLILHLACNHRQIDTAGPTPKISFFTSTRDFAFSVSLLRPAIASTCNRRLHNRWIKSHKPINVGSMILKLFQFYSMIFPAI